MGFTIRGLNPSRSKRLFFTPEASKVALGPTQLPSQWIPASFPGTKAVGVVMSTSPS